MSFPPLPHIPFENPRHPFLPQTIEPDNLHHRWYILSLSKLRKFIHHDSTIAPLRSSPLLTHLSSTILISYTNLFKCDLAQLGLTQLLDQGASFRTPLHSNPSSGLFKLPIYQERKIRIAWDDWNGAVDTFFSCCPPWQTPSKCSLHWIPITTSGSNLKTLRDGSVQP